MGKGSLVNPFVIAGNCSGHASMATDPVSGLVFVLNLYL